MLRRNGAEARKAFQVEYIPSPRSKIVGCVLKFVTRPLLARSRHAFICICSDGELVPDVGAIQPCFPEDAIFVLAFRVEPIL